MCGIHPQLDDLRATRRRMGCNCSTIYMTSQPPSPSGSGGLYSPSRDPGANRPAVSFSVMAGRALNLWISRLPPDWHSVGREQTSGLLPPQPIETLLSVQRLTELLNRAVTDN